MIYYGKRSCSIDCSSECCYFPKPGELIKETEIKRLKNVVKNKLSDFHPQYRDLIRKIVEVDGFVVIGRLIHI